MGLGHRFGELLAATQELADERFRFVFCGDGKRRREIQNFADCHPECRIELRGYALAGELNAHLMSADVHVASLDSAWTGTMVPSKLQGVFAVGKPLIFIGSSDSSIGRWVHESGGGWLVNPNDVAGLIAALREARVPDLRRMKGAAARTHAIRYFGQKTNVSEITNLMTGER
jgi:colanic acid biosynthesis glycosyl transferase WcaI